MITDGRAIPTTSSLSRRPDQPELQGRQGRSQPNDQAAALMLLVRTYPDTLEHLKAVAT